LRNALALIDDGATIHIDGNNGEIRVVDHVTGDAS
jgi:hypothetical protein